MRCIASASSTLCCCTSCLHLAQMLRQSLVTQVTLARQRWEMGQRERAREAARLAAAQAALKAAEQTAWAALKGAEQTLQQVLVEQGDGEQAGTSHLLQPS